jgi:MFS family permease
MVGGRDNAFEGRESRWLLRRHGTFGRFWTARAISHLGDGAALVALVLFIQQSRGTGVAVSALLLAETLPNLFGPAAGAIADRMDQRRLMLFAEIGQGLTYAAIAAFLPPFPVLLALVATASMLHTVFAPAGRSAVPLLVGREDLMRANAWMGMALNLQGTIGLAMGGVLAASVGIRGALLANAITFAIGAALLLRLPALPPEVDTERAGLLRETRAGLSYALRHPVARAIVVGLGLGVLFAAVDDVALVFLAREELGVGALGFGVLASSYGVGMVVAALVLMRGGTRAAGQIFVLGWLLTGLGGLATGLAPAFAVALVAQTVAGSGNGLDNVAVDTLVQRTVPRRRMGRVFGVVTTAALFGGATARGLGGVLLDLTSARTTFVIGGVGVLLATAVAGMMLARAGWGSEPD